MEYKNSNEKEVIIDIESGETNHGAEMKNDPNSGNKWGKKSLNKLVSGVLGLNGLTNIESDVNSGACSHETTGLLVDNNQGRNLLPLLDQDNEKERRKAGKPKKAPKPPRPPKGPSLDAADMRLIKEISKMAMKKRERIERIKALRKMKAARMSSSSSSSGGTISAMIFTVLFFLVIIFQGLGWSSSSKAILTATGAPQPAPETALQFYETVLSDDGAAPGFEPPKSTRQLSASEFTSLG